MCGKNSDSQLRRDLRMTSQIRDSEVRGYEFSFATIKHIGEKGGIQKRPKLPLKLKLQIALHSSYLLHSALVFSVSIGITV